ncbi:MAG: hypothetical protein R3A48_12200 [Polyangiales bacterium]
MPIHDTGMQYCPRCSLEHPRGRCAPTKVAHETLLLCPSCGGVTRAVTVTEREPLLAVYGRAWRYALSSDGAVALVALAIGSWLLSLVPLVGGLLAAGVKLSYLFSVIRATARGSDDLPHAVEFEGWSDVIRPTVRATLAMVVALAPLMFSLGYAHDSPALYPLVALSATWAAAYLPGAMLVASLHEGCLGGANPLPVLELARRIPRDYAVTAGVLVALCVPMAMINAAAARVAIPVPVLSTVLKIALEAVALAMPLGLARILGLLLRERADEVALDE